MPRPLVKIENASAFYPGLLPRKPVLANISWQIMPGCHCALSGPNGAGKSSLLKLVHGDLWPQAGAIQWLDGEKYSSSPIAARKLTGLVAPHIQAACQRAGWNVRGRDMLAGAAADAPFSFAAEAEDAAAAENLLGGLEAAELLDLRLPELSQGQLRLLLLARELMRKPALLLLDEWNEGLDQKRQGLVLARLEALASESTLVFATHRQNGLPGWIQDWRHVNNGEFCARPAPARAFVSHAVPGPPVRTGQPVFELANVSVYIDSKPVLHNIDWSMRQGENWLIGGPNGAGKSAFLRLLAGDEFIHAGGSLKFWPRGASRPARSLAEKRRAISLVSDLAQALYGYDLTALELILSGIDNAIGLYRDFDNAEIAWARELLARFFPENARTISGQSIRRLSSGQLRRLFLARALAARPEVLLLDEPVSNLDQESEDRYLAMLAKLASSGIDGQKPALVAVSHQPLPEIFNREAIMENGRLSQK
ncbi:MAG: ATP-binding cassette domain-containing protein [Desulfovibrio sp.]|nr:ATP-binding cassette domain-containing protein [Desulfovibrio sp.]